MSSIAITLTNDSMIAYLSGVFEEQRSEEEIRNHIMEMMTEKGIVYGLQKKLIDTVVSDLHQMKKVELSIVALGEYPKPDKAGGITFSIPTYFDTVLDPLSLPDFEKPVFYYQLLPHIQKPYIVKKNEKIGELGVGQPGRPGYTVLGDMIHIENQMKSPDELGNGLITQINSSEIFTACMGIVIRRRNFAFILPVNTDAQVRIDISKDKLRVYLSLFPAGPDGKEMTMQDIMDELARKSITYGINHEKIQALLTELVNTGKSIEGECVAEGLKPVPGKDASIDYFVNLSFSQVPTIREDGSADYFSIHMFENVSSGQALAKIVPPTEGTPGIDVYGNRIEAPRGKNVKLSLGKNVASSPNNDSLLVAQKTGHVYARNNSLFVEDVLTIGTDIDYNTGNVSFVGDIVIKGDVKSGFKVKADGSITVEGTVEDAVIEAKKSVIIQQGFIGRGKGRIKAGENVVVKHVRNQTIIAKNNIMIDGESIDANLFAGNEMFVEVKRSWIVGGVTVARNRVRAYAIGNTAHVRTEIAVGVDVFVQKILEQLENEIHELENEVKIIKINEKRLLIEDQNDESTRKEREGICNQLHTLSKKLEKKIAKLQKYKNRYQKSLYDASGNIGVIDTIYPGVVLKIGNRRLAITTAVKGCLFYIFKNSIRSRSIV